MLVFVDESGDTGLKLGHGSSEHLTIAIVLFEDLDIASAVDRRISELRTELGLSAKFEFHFGHNSDGVREAFFRAVGKFEFFYLAFVVNKSELYSENFKSKGLFYNYICGLVFENAKPYLRDAKVKFDKCGDRLFKKELSHYLKRKLNSDGAEKCIKSVGAEDSKGNNLIQLADMICGAVARSFQTDRSDRHRFRRMVIHREVNVRFWPKEE